MQGDCHPSLGDRHLNGERSPRAESMTASSKEVPVSGVLHQERETRITTYHTNQNLTSDETGRSHLEGENRWHSMEVDDHRNT